MTKCEFCGLEMTTADGCKCCEIEIDGEFVKRIRYGDPGDLGYGYDLPARCHDCAAKIGFYHHPGCDGEACPKCGMQLLMCTCDVGRLVWYE